MKALLIDASVITRFDDIVWEGYDAIVIQGATATVELTGFVAPSDDNNVLIVINKSPSIDVYFMSQSTYSSSGNRIETTNPIAGVLSFISEGNIGAVHYDSANSQWLFEAGTANN